MIALVLCLLAFFPSFARADDMVVLGEFSTKFSTKGENTARAHNVVLAAAMIDGTIVQPGEEFSYNRALGERTAKSGFRLAHAIVKDKLVDQLGGGICQVSSTTHVAALQAGLTIVEHHTHSRVSFYIGPSLDATVDWGRLDMRFVNDNPFPVTIDTDTSTPGLLTVKILGAYHTKNVVIETVVTNKKQFAIRRVNVAYIRPGRVKKIEPGTIGCDVTRHRTVIDLTSGEKKLETVKYHYDKSDRIIHVGQQHEEQR